MRSSFDFLWAGEDVGDPRRALVIQTGNPGLLTRVVDRLREVLPRTEFTVLLQKGMDEFIERRGSVSYIPNEGSKVELVRALRDSNFEVVFVLYSNERGYWKLKLLPFVVGAPRVFGINENLDWFPVSARRGEVLAQHLRWRFEASIPGLAGDSGVFGKAVFYPVLLAYLLIYERTTGWLAQANGAPDWKRENRPKAAGPVEGGGTGTM